MSQVTGGLFTAMDFSLFHHFIVSTSSYLGNDSDTPLPWKTGIPSIAPHHPYLLHEMLAVAAIHLHRSHPNDGKDYQRIAQDHQALALSQFRVALSSRDADEEASALLACSALMANYYFAAFDDPASLLFNTEELGPPEWILPIRGCAAIVGHFRDPLRAGSMGPVLNTYGPFWNNAILSPNGSESDLQIQVLQTKLTNLTLGDVNQDIYGSALRILRRCFMVSEQGGDTSLKTAAMTFPSLVSDEFLEEMCRRKRPAALVIISFWCVLLNRLDRKYWLRGDSVPRAILGVIKSHLPPDFLDLIQWPIREIGFDDSEVGGGEA